MSDEIQAPSQDSSEQVSSVPSFLRHPKGKLLIGVLAAMVLVAILVGQVYARPVTDPLVRVFAQIIPFPAISVDGETVTIKEFLAEYDALSTSFEDAGDSAPPPDQLEIAIVDTLINKIAIQKLASEYGVVVNTERVEQYYQEIIEQEGEEAFVKNLSETFGWSEEEFKERIVESIVLALQMTDVVLEDEATQQPRRDLIDSAYARVQSGEDFATIAKDVHAGFEGIEGDLGYVKVSVIPESWKSQVETLEEGQATGIIDLPEGYAVFKLEEKIVAGEDTQVHLLSITVPKVTLEEVVDAYLMTVEVKRYVGEE